MERDREDIEVLNLPTKVAEKIKQIKEDYLAAYIMIDVAGKNGQEMLSEELEKALKNSPKFLALSHYLDETSSEEVWLTDDSYNIEDELDSMVFPWRKELKSFQRA